MAVRLTNIIKRYLGPDGSVVPVIDIPDFLLDDSEQAALIGSSGSGKTTLLHLIAGILIPDSGQILFGPARGGPGTVNLTHLTEAQRDIFRGQYIGYIFQTHHLLPGFTALENVLLGMTFTRRAHDPAWAMHLLNAVGLADRLHYKPAKLSVGQQQRVAVARALANRPTLVLADEPTGALDNKNARQVLELICNLCSEISASLLMVTHDLDVASKLGRTYSLSQLNRAAMAEAAP